MIDVQETEAFSDWFKSLRDIQARASIIARIRRLSQGNAGDAAAVGEGVSEMRIHIGPGYRVYFCRNGAYVYVLLGGGDKSTQKGDIAGAIKMARDLGDSK